MALSVHLSVVVCVCFFFFSGQKHTLLTEIWKINYSNKCVQETEVSTKTLTNMKKHNFLWRGVCLCYRVNVNMIRKEWKSVIIWIIIFSENAILCSSVLALPAAAAAAGTCAKASQFPPDYSDTGSYLFSSAVRLPLFLWQKLQLLLMTGNLKVPLLNSHRCHVVWIK